MQLNVDFSGLHEGASQMGFSGYRMRRWADAYAMASLHHRLSAGTGIGLHDLQVTGGVLGLYGMQVFLYNPDQRENIDSVLASQRSSTVFHLAQCSVLQEALNVPESDPYVAANRLSTNCRVYGFSRGQGRKRSGVARLQVCEQCLHRLNYKGFRTQKHQRARILQEFDLAEWFARFSTLFGRYPLAQEAAMSVADWENNAALYRRQRGEACECCAVGLRQHNRLLHTVYLNGDRQDLRPDNMRVLCLDCHRKQVSHAHLPLKEADMRLIQCCRRQQGLLDNIDWQKAIRLADSAFDGLLRCYRQQSEMAPEIAYELHAASPQETMVVELAWPSQKRAVSADIETARRLAQLGWHCLTLDEAMASI